MARELQPCGTPAARKRHERNGDPPCDDCKRAEREARAAEREAKRLESMRLVASAVEAAPPVEDVDPLEDARDNLKIVKAAMQDAPHNTIAQLSKRRQELVELIKELSSADPGVSLKDELAAARDARRSAGA